MRRAASAPKQNYLLPDVVTHTVPVPTDGWDAISPLADMDPKRAVILTNWTPRPGFVELRAGSAVWCQALSGLGPVETLLVLRQPTTQRMFAATNGKIIEVTNSGQGTLIQSGFSSNRWQYTNFTPPSGTTVIQLCNGVDSLQQYDGTTWSQPAVTAPANWTFNSWSTTNIVNIFAGKQRLWYVVKNSTIVVFGGVGQITGQPEGFQDLGTLFTKGGFLVSVFDWTIDAGEGPNSYTAFWSSEGQLAVYQGVDPGNTSLWSFVGTWDLPKPVGFRCVTKLGTDAALITYQGLLPVSQAIPYDPSAARSAALTRNIQNAMNQAVQMWAGNFGWQFITLPLQTLGFLNIPQATNSVAVQYVMNMLDGAWTQFTAWNANCFELFNQQLYFGDNSGNVWLAYQGPTDGVNPINADMLCAFNWFDEPGRNKEMKMIQPIITGDGQVTPNISINVDFSTTQQVSSQTQQLSGGATWDNAIWDQDVWSTGLVTINSWLGANGIGKAIGVRTQVAIAPSTGLVGVFDKSTFDNAVFDGTNSNQITLQVAAFNAIMELGGPL